MDQPTNVGQVRSVGFYFDYVRQTYSNNISCCPSDVKHFL